MKLKSVLAGMILLVISPLTLADTSLPAVPSFKDGWTAIGGTAQAQIVHLLNIIFMLAVIGSLIYTLYGVFNYMYGGRSHNPEQRTAGFGQIVLGLFVLMLIVVIYEIIVNMFTAT